jgi:serine/threonine protein kinase
VSGTIALLDEKWIVEREIASGGMGRIFRARSAKDGRVVALKTIHEALTSDSMIVRRFEREARAIAALRSKHVVAILEVDRLPSGAPYLVMEYLEGKDLETIRQERSVLAIADVVRWSLEACEGIAEAHRAGIIHRDLKPQNLFLANQPDGPPIVKVLDFGLAKALPGGKLPASSDTATATGSVMGTPFFMSPEQIRALPSIDHRTDIWSFGATLFELLTGRTPFNAPNLHLLRARILREDPTPLRKLRPEASLELAEIVDRCLRRAPEERFSSVDEVADALRRAPLTSTVELEREGDAMEPALHDTIDESTVPGQSGDRCGKSIKPL